MTVLREAAVPAWLTRQCRYPAQARPGLGQGVLSLGCRFTVPMGTRWGGGGAFFFGDKGVPWHPSICLWCQVLAIGWCPCHNDRLCSIDLCSASFLFSVFLIPRCLGPR